MTDTGYRYDPRAAVLACFTAGPIFVAVLCGAALIGDPGSIMNAGDVIRGLVFALPLSVPFGAVLALVPVALGAGLLAWLARRSGTAAEWWVWIVTGALMGGGIGLCLTLSEPLAALVLGATGAACAAVARRGLRRE